MKLIKKLIPISFVFFILQSTVFAANEYGVHMSKPFGMFLTCCAMLLTSSILILIYGGFQYMMGGTDSPKTTIIYAGSFAFISCFIMIFVRLGFTLSSNLEVKPVPPSSLVTFLSFVVIFILLLLGRMLLSYIANRPSEKEKPYGKYTETKVVIEPNPISVSVQDIASFLEEIKTTTYHVDAYVTSIKSDKSNLEGAYSFQVKKNTSTIKLFSNKTLLLTSTLDLGTSEQSYVVEQSVFLQGDQTTLHSHFTQTHIALSERYLKQHSSFQNWVDYLLQYISSDTIRLHIKELATHHHLLLSYHQQLNTEQQFFLENSFVNDFTHVLSTYKELSDTKQTNLEAELIQRLNVLKAKLKDVQDSVDMHLERDVFYAFRVIDGKYTENIDK